MCGCTLAMLPTARTSRFYWQLWSVSRRIQECGREAVCLYQQLNDVEEKAEQNVE